MILCCLRARPATAAVTALLVGLCTALTACRPLSNSTASGASACPTPQPGVTASAIKIGLIYPDTGPAEIAAAFMAARSGVEARIDLQNAHGGVNDRVIDLVWGDDQSDPQTFSLVAHDLVDDQRVFGLITPSIVLDKSAGWLEKDDVPVTGTATSAAWSDYPNLFHAGNLFNTGGASVFGDFVKAQGGTTALVVVDPNVAASQSLARQFAPSLQSRGIRVLGEVTYTDGVTNPDTVADQLQQSGADTLVGAAQSGPFIDIYSRATALGVKLKVALSATGFSPSLIAQRGTDMAGMSIMSSIATQGSPALTAYRGAMSTYAPELADPTDELALAGYVAADEMIEGVQLAGGCPTRQAFIQNLRKVTDFSANGLIPPIDLSHPKQPTLCENFIKVGPAGRSFVPVPPPAALDRDGYWCGVPLQ
ncbi:ABC transporter substrate-binding protein [Frankia sp. AgB1.9]|uniref:ABC transporter substrate-binding protein n=1 Tax=unclassified Frankia TaxID=2632575 RepID=UPI001932759C|nr:MULTISPECIES: ABC transporter substrate-binding protein [unclassified Frankia]MBL7494242.1 ABC transporter substrate-binding protein [Frankia sp. AgW1.1]MBL7552451.1 ABC transporter substrate-binding protein [Frankia sp. AgB1.9]MBL7623553.1 ABC transporter substrate-binding protein [Frankia sp. AgB1.8]